MVKFLMALNLVSKAGNLTNFGFLVFILLAVVSGLFFGLPSGDDILNSFGIAK